VAKDTVSLTRRRPLRVGGGVVRREAETAAGTTGCSPSERPRIQVDKDTRALTSRFGPTSTTKKADVVKSARTSRSEKDRVVDGDVVVIGGSLTIFGRSRASAFAWAHAHGRRDGCRRGRRGQAWRTVVKELDAKISATRSAPATFLPAWIFTGPWPQVRLVRRVHDVLHEGALRPSHHLDSVDGAGHRVRWWRHRGQRSLASFGLGPLDLLLTQSR